MFPLDRRTRFLRLAFLLGLLIFWFASQHVIVRTWGETRAEGVIADRVLSGTESVHDYLQEHTGVASLLLTLSSLEIDLLVLWIAGVSLFGFSARLAVGLGLILVLRQGCQALVGLPVPEGILWYDPGFPSLLQTYGIADDFFFSGHTAICTFGALSLARAYPRIWGRGRAWILVLFPVAVVLLLRAHYFLDVYAGLVTALLVERWVHTIRLPGWLESEF